MKIDLINPSRQLLHIADGSLINRFYIRNKGKKRKVNNPIPELKEVLKVWNQTFTAYYAEQLQKNNLTHIAHAYLPNKSIVTNAKQHKNSKIIQFDFTGFYDSCKFNYIYEDLKQLDDNLNDTNKHIVRRLLIDPETDGLTQGAPTSGALAGITMIPFWLELKSRLPSNIRFTQYSDDLTFSFIGKEPKEFTIPYLSQVIYESLHHVGLDFNINTKKTRIQTDQYRKVTGIRINHHNQLTPSRKDYRFLRHALFILSKSDSLEDELQKWGFSSKASFVGKISYMRSIDETGKVMNIIMKYRHTCRKHDIFTTWIDNQYRQSAFA